MRRAEWVAARWLGVGVTACLAVVTIGLALGGQLALYINPDSAWFAVSMAVLALVGTVATFLVPLGAEADHGHDHGDVPHGIAHAHDHREHDHGSDHDHGSEHVDHGDLDREELDREAETVMLAPRRALAIVATVTGGVLASGITVAALVLPPASLSVELAMARDVGAPPLFAGMDSVTLATSGDTSSFGIGEWATVFATSTHPDTFEGESVKLTGFLTPDPDDPDSVRLTRLVITHCVIDAQPAALPVLSPGWESEHEVGDWVELDGTVRTGADGTLVIEPATVTAVPEPADPYEY
ncbi:MAG TPA: DUF1980 domain-containing protein [Microbacterium sp.]|uniref:TIGR03943 family putative permease subunit n=1 Tax=Microbacterium sp. TaxID=51671 RepID=UPI002CDAB57B|nr:DUF1980 domain-containing protein [Microbacterium sp.]HWI30154.1 DUF1980 domain-containing protein [Microbacterium sp.]